MSHNQTINRQVVLVSRPHGAPTLDNFELCETAIPEPQAGQVLLRTEYLSLDPYMRGRMSDAPSYAPFVALGETMVGGTVSRVVTSKHDEYDVAVSVVVTVGWQVYGVED